MNIFLLDADPVISARYHCDKHINKMILESCQMLSTAWHVLEGRSRKVRRPLKNSDGSVKLRNDGRPHMRSKTIWSLGFKPDGRIPKPTHINHGCNVWVRSHWSAYAWLWQMTFELCHEKRHRFGTDHAYHHNGVMMFLNKIPPSLCDNDTPWSRMAMDRPLHLDFDVRPNAPPYLAIGDERRHEAAILGHNPVVAYRNFYFETKDFATWEKDTLEPHWFTAYKRRAANVV